MKDKNIVEVIQSKLTEKSISAYKLEKQLGLKRSSINNILYGKSKKPSINIIQAIAKGLDCSVSELLEEKTEQKFQLCEKDLEIVDSLSENITNNTLYHQALQSVGSVLSEKKIFLSKKQIFNCVEETYKYSLKGAKNQIDIFFTEWIIDKYQELEE